MEKLRKPYIGLWNIVRFNWHFYVLALLALLILGIAAFWLNPPYDLLAVLMMILALSGTLISLAVSHYIYDLSNLYQLSWLDQFGIQKPNQVLNIHAGFDETSELIALKYPEATLQVFDFYDPVKHTEVSIQRARKAYPPYPGTLSVKTDKLPLQRNAVDYIFVILSAHEIRDEGERIQFFRELVKALKPGGKVIVTEHLRDLANFLAFNVGFFHFYSKTTWFKTFEAAGLQLGQEQKITPFISTFMLSADGDTP